MQSQSLMITRIAAALAFAVLSLAGATGTLAQYDASNVSLYAEIPPGDVGSTAGNDCWGYTSPTGREYALMSYNNQLVVVEITDPANPDIVGSVSHANSTWGDVKVYKSYAYHCNEASGGIQIIDLSAVDSGQVSLVGTFGPSTNHNVAINEDSGFLYTCGSGVNGGRPVVYDLSNPSSPVEVGRITSLQGDYVHDAHIVNMKSGPYAGHEILFGASEGRGVDIFDVTDKGNMVRLSRTPYPGVSYCHQLWSNDDHTILYVDDELDELYGQTNTTRTLIFDVTDLENPVLVNTFTTNLPAIDHNLYYKDGFIYESNYTSGLRIFDANSDPFDPVEVGYFDTYPNGDGADFEGAWSVFPYFDSGTVIISDINRGLFIVDPSAALSGLIFKYPNGRPDLVDPAGGTTFQLSVSGRGVDPQPGTGHLHYNIGGGWVEVELTQTSDNKYDVVIPESNCGSNVLYYVSAETTEGDRLTDPSNAPDKTYVALSGSSLDEYFADDFESDKGWTVESIQLTGGEWERGVPVGDGSRGDPTEDADGSGSCYLTENGAGNTDVDGGPTRLISPIFDLTSGDSYMSYYDWFYNDDDDIDSLVCEISNDGGQTWEFVDETFSTTGAWVKHTFRVSDIVTPTATVQVRFSVADNPNDSVTEAGIDGFSIDLLECVGTCLNLDVTDLVSGQASNFTISKGTPGSKVAVLYAFQEGSLQSCSQGSMWCVDFGIDVPANKANKRVVVLGTFNDAGLISRSRFIPGGLSGQRILFQAAQSDTYPNPCMSDIIDEIIQ